MTVKWSDFTKNKNLTFKKKQKTFNNKNLSMKRKYKNVITGV